MPHQDRVNIAVFIDFDNIEIGVKTTLGEHFDVGTILDAIKERGEVVTKIAYADWTRAGEYSRTLTQHAIRLVQRNLTPGGDKNGADINLALDALEMAFTHPHINAYVIVGGDSDFLSLVEKLKQYDKKVFVVGGRAFTSIILQRNCHEFIAYENLVARRPTIKGGRPSMAAASTPIAQAFPIVRRALKILADREVSPQTGLLKSTLLQLDSTFSERNYGASSFLDFAEKLAQSGLVSLKHAGRSVMVELNAGFSEDGDAAQRPRPILEAEPVVSADQTQTGFVAAAPAPVAFAAAPVAPAADQPDQPFRPTESTADGVQRVARVLSAATTARWPMYLRNVKQILRAADGSFDERRYGFGGLIDLLRACQREGFVRMERDRRGGLRVFQGPALRQAAATEATEPMAMAPQLVEHVELPGEVAVEVAEIAALAPTGFPDAEVIASNLEPEAEPEAAPEPIPIDTTAELLGRAKPKGTRSRTQRSTTGASGHSLQGTRKPAAKKPATKRRTTAGRRENPPTA
ncbi:MAG TPA: NYN domain-containing protein [Vicinamibacterales bacterium]|nr:NYN domain-containing protein [Vicinamibacterales bacterium]